MNKIEIIEKKICPGCNKELPASSFYRRNPRTNALRTYCKECTKIQNMINEEQRRETSMSTNSTKSTTPPIVTDSTLTKVKTLRDYTPRELLKELKDRGYVWEQMYRKEYVPFSNI